jgi:hypothetical protein
MVAIYSGLPTVFWKGLVNGGTLERCYPSLPTIAMRDLNQSRINGFSTEELRKSAGMQQHYERLSTE